MILMFPVFFFNPSDLLRDPCCRCNRLDPVRSDALSAGAMGAIPPL